MLELIKAMKSGREYFGIRNFYFKTDKGEVYKNDVREVNKEIDDLRFPDRDIYSSYFHIKDFKDNITKRVISGRGCPFNCTYCYNHALKEIYHQKGRYLRVRSVENVVKEMDFLKREYEATCFDFVDDVFGMNPSWLQDFSTKYNETISLPFSCLTHVEFINERYVSNLRKAGCRLLSLGVETADETYRRNVLGRAYTNEDIYSETKLLHKYGIPFCTFNMLLLPGENVAMAIGSLKLNMKCRPFDAFVAIYQPFPGTELAQYAVQNGFLDEHGYMIPDSLFSESVLKNPRKPIIVRLFYLFSLTVKFRYLYPLTRVLIHLPFGRLYRKLYQQYKNAIRKRYLFGLSRLNERMHLSEILWNLLVPRTEGTFLEIAAKKDSTRENC